MERKQNKKTIINFLTGSIILIIKFYKIIISPFIGKRCRFYPTCSDYFIGSLKYNGLTKGIIKGIIRIIRCNPINPGGYDPVRKN
ncbi:membrane protein insertion efficiency factor YidD [Elusimicrobiota bacterium]